jgi:hypothetical protein
MRAPQGRACAQLKVAGARMRMLESAESTRLAGAVAGAGAPNGRRRMVIPRDHDHMTI